MSPHPYFLPKQTSLLPFIISHESLLLPHYPLCSNLKIRHSSLNIILKAEESSTITSLPARLILLLMHPNGTSFSLLFFTFALIFSMSFECIIHFKSEGFSYKLFYRCYYLRLLGGYRFYNDQPLFKYLYLFDLIPHFRYAEMDL